VALRVGEQGDLQGSARTTGGRDLHGGNDGPAAEHIGRGQVRIDVRNLDVDGDVAGGALLAPHATGDATRPGGDDAVVRVARRHRVFSIEQAGVEAAHRIRVLADHLEEHHRIGHVVSSRGWCLGAPWTLPLISTTIGETRNGHAWPWFPLGITDPVRTATSTAALCTMCGSVLPVRYLALGDSYTICTGATSPAQRWPSVIARRLEETLGRAVDVTNLGVNGYTTSQLIAHELPHLGDAAWDCISVLVGANDLYQGYDEPHYHARLVQIYDAIAAVSGARVLAVSIPDFSYTPVGRASRASERTLELLRVFNAGARVTAEMRGFTWVDVLEVSRARIGTPGWIAGDGLHPGDLQYAAWADHIWPVVQRDWTALRG